MDHEKYSDVTAGGDTVPPDAAQRENQPTDREKRGWGKREKGGERGRKEGKKGGKGRKKGGRKKRRKEGKKEGKEGKGKERKRERKINLVFLEYQVNKITKIKTMQFTNRSNLMSF